MNIVHRDIKPENLLVDSTIKLKLCDFGFARTIKKSTEKLTDYVATRWYRSPELLITSGYYGQEIDYWAIGCIMGELADGDPLFPGDNEIDQLIVIQKVLGKLPESQFEIFQNNLGLKGKIPEFSKPETLERRYMGKLSKQAINFMKLLLHPDPKHRLKGDSVFSHPYFDNYPDPFPSQKKEFSMPANVPVNEKKVKKEVPVITNTTNINIINYNNYDGKNNQIVQNSNDSVNDKNNSNLTKFNSILTGQNGLNFTNDRKIINSQNLNSKSNLANNMLLTSYNFNQNIKENINEIVPRCQEQSYKQIEQCIKSHCETISENTVTVRNANVKKKQFWK
jgi:cyclin-dependent kinase-like